MEPIEQMETGPLLHTQEVRGSSPCAPTIRINSLRCSTKVICGASAYLAGDLGSAQIRPIDKCLNLLTLRGSLHLKCSAHSDDADQSIRSDADQFGGKQRRAFSV